MKAMILAAGFGTRLLPYTRLIPKPLFSMGEKPVLEILIENLIQGGCHEVIINTHHLADQIEFFLSHKHFPIPVNVSYEPEILGTGGAIKNVENFWGDLPFMVINSDVVTDINFKSVYDFHLRHGFAATLVLTDCTGLNSVSADSACFIRDFWAPQDPDKNEKPRRFTFTGIQVLDKQVLEYLPGGGFYSIIDAYIHMIKNGNKIKAFFATENYWKDIGTPERYRQAVLDRMIPDAFLKAFSQYPLDPVLKTRLKGDGSDRGWFRLESGKKTLILGDHGIYAGKDNCEAGAFVKIGQHLHNQGVPVPRIFHENSFSGHVFVEDLGDTLLQKVVLKHPDSSGTRKLYEKITKALCHMWIRGADGFDLSWTYQSTHYDRRMILDQECRYFTESFLNGYLGLKIGFEELAEDFNHLADRIAAFTGEGFMHRDFQSRNIMINGTQIYFIDFQAGRLGPIQYDLASLLIDPYTALSRDLQAHLLEFCIHFLNSLMPIAPNDFKRGFHYCAVSRNLQILGAFAHLSLIKKKRWFEAYIPQAINTLKNNLYVFFENKEFRRLKYVLEKTH